MVFQLVRLVRTVFLVLLRVEMLLMLVRALLSWIPNARGAVYEFIVMMTEPVIMPVRRVVDRFMGKSALPVDVSFIAAYLLLYLLSLILGAV